MGWRDRPARRWLGVRPGVQNPTGTPLVWLLYDNFLNADAAPITSPRTPEPGPGNGVVVDTTNKASISDGSLVLNGVNAAGDPGFWMRNVGPVEFDPLPGHAAFFDATPTGGAGFKDIELGFDAGVSGHITNPYFRKYSATLRAENETGGDVTIGAWVDDQRSKLLLIPRNTQRTFHYVQDGKLLWAGTAALADATLNLAASNLNAVIGIHQMGLLSLPANGYPKWGADFSMVTDSKTNPVSGVTYNADADLLLDATFTVEDTKFIQWKFRYQDFTNYLFVDVNSGRSLLIRQRIGAEFTNLYIGSALTDSTEYNIKLVANGTSIKLYLDNVLQASVTESTFLTETGGVISTDYVARGIFSTHPYPALGIAADRIIAPQEGDTTTHTADCLVYGRGVTLPSAGSLQYELRKSGSDEITLDIDSNGKPIIKENADARITGANGNVSNDDDWCVRLDGTNVSLLVAGTQIGATYESLSLTDGTTFNMASIGTAGSTNSVELWPSRPLLPAELV